jgi:hypothetical protein
MRMTSRVVLSALFGVVALPFAACSGGGSFSVAEGGAGDGGSGSSSGSSSGGSSGSSSGSSSGGDGGHATDAGDSGLDCTALLAVVNAARLKAQACCAACQIAQCGATAADFCCPITVSSTSSTDVQAFEATRQAYIAQCGQTPCPNISCPVTPSNACGLDGECK